eukprot:TRINITY_DN4994_c0_g1_i2.p1 TRINITY_DN4994_c0_g1~~TRINITY_DN4994_c0_g1_i2.p1  ORF type:complete len:151 (-),score=32.84 TRINITY_DN4994_c0_g1_i2:227-679(-)
MVSPPESGIFSGQWRMKTAAGNICGDIIWVIISVEVNGILGVTQQMNDLPIGQKFNLDSQINPFAPSKSQSIQILNNSHGVLTNSNSISPIKQPDSTSGHAAPPPSPLNSQFGNSLQFHNSLLAQLNQENIGTLTEEPTEFNTNQDTYYS